MANNIDFLIARVTAYKNILTKKDPKEIVGIQGKISQAIAKEFNSLLEDIKKQSPDVGSHLPQPIPYDEMYTFAYLTYVDLEIKVEQVLAVLGVIKAN